jgi:PKD repeat protein
MNLSATKSRRSALPARQRLLIALGAVTLLVLVLPVGALAATVTASQRSSTLIIDAGSAACDSPTATCNWSLDGGVQTATGASASFSTAAGDHTVAVSVSDGLLSDSGSANLHVYGPVTAGFTATPTTGASPLGVSFGNTSSGEITNLAWQFGDGQGTSQVSPSHIYSTGSYTAKLTVSNPAFTSTATQPITVGSPPPPNNAPVAAILATPTQTGIGGTVTFDASGSTDPDAGDFIASYAWDLNGDNKVDATTATASLLYTTPGTYKITLTVKDSHGTPDKAFETVTVLSDKAPIPSFSFSPASPNVGDVVTFTGSATDPDLPPGKTLALAWDLDNDGQYDDGTGPTATWTFSTAGSRIVGFQATDEQGAKAVAFQTVTVTGPTTGQSSAQPPPGSTPASPPQGPASSSRRLRLMSPFPIIRIRGLLYARYVRISVLSVRAPKGATIKVLCHGRSCGKPRYSKKVRTAARSLRFSGYERRLRAGTVIEVFVTSKNVIGKYTRFTMRSNAAPVRRDLCLRPGSSKPVKCPSQ